MELKFKLQAAALNSALDVVSIVPPRPITPQGGMGYLFIVRNDASGNPRCYVYSRDTHRVARADFAISDVEGEGAFIYPSNFVEAFKHVDGDITFSIQDDGTNRMAKYTFGANNAAESEVPIFDYRLIAGCDKELSEAETDEKKFSVAILREAIGMANPFLPKPNDQHLQEQYKTIQLFDASGQDGARADGNLFASNSVQAFFFQCDALKGRTLAIHGQHLPLVTAFLQKCTGEITVRRGANMTFAIGTADGREQVLGWVHHKAKYDKFMYYATSRDKIIMSVPKDIALSRLAYTKAMLDPKRDKIRVMYDHTNSTLQFRVLEGNAKAKDLPFTVGVKEGSESRSFECNVNIDHLIELFKGSKAQDVELRVAFSPPAENRPREVVMFRTIDEFWIDNAGKVVGGSGVAAGKEPEGAFQCKVTRFMPDKA